MGERVTRSVGKSSFISAEIGSSQEEFRKGITFEYGSSSRAEEGWGDGESTEGETRFVLSQVMFTGTSRELLYSLSATGGGCTEVLVTKLCAYSLYCAGASNEVASSKPRV